MVSNSTHVSGRGSAGAYRSGKASPSRARSTGAPGASASTAPSASKYACASSSSRSAPSVAGPPSAVPRAFDRVAQAESAPLVERLLEHRQAAFEPAPAPLASSRDRRAGSCSRRSTAACRLVAEQREAVGQRQPAPRRAQHAEPRRAVAEVRQRRASAPAGRAPRAAAPSGSMSVAWKRMPRRDSSATMSSRWLRPCTRIAMRASAPFGLAALDDVRDRLRLEPPAAAQEGVQRARRRRCRRGSSATLARIPAPRRAARRRAAAARARSSR